MSGGSEQFGPWIPKKRAVRRGMEKSMLMLDPTPYYSQRSHGWQLLRKIQASAGSDLLCTRIAQK